MRLRTRTLELIVSSIAVVSACAAAPPDVAQPIAPSPAVATVRPATGSAPQVVIDRARRALREAGLPADAKLAYSEATQWNDSSLGCAQPGMQYLQVITSGYALRFVDRGNTHEVHVAGEQAVICALSLAGAPKRPGQARSARGLEQLVERAREDLAHRLGLAVETVKLLDAQTIMWPDGGLGCNFPRNERGAPVAGYQLLLSAGVERYAYHTDLNAAYACPPIERE